MFPLSNGSCAPPAPPPPPQAWDSETVSLLLALSLLEEDLSDLQSRQKGKQRAGTITDIEAALSLSLDDLQCTSQVLKDRRIAESYADAIATDQTVIATIVAEEARARNDRRIAEGIAGLQNPPGPVGEELAEDNDDLESVISETMTATVIEGRSSHRASQRITENYYTTKMCIVCSDRHPVNDIITVEGCKHHYCCECALNLFRLAMTDETLYPPRCCSKNLFEIPAVLDIMSNEDAEEFRKKMQEYESNDRTYCANLECGMFVGDGLGRDLVECMKCGENTCTHCKKLGHVGRECKADEALQSVLRVAEESGWKRCPRCRAMVELRFGCNHMTCNCSAQWCYVCTLPWKTCTCARWDEANLIARAQQVVEREAPRELPQVEMRRMIEVVQRELRDEGDCWHPGRWQRVEGEGDYQRPRRGYRCEFCADRHWKYILRCRHCHIQACEFCRRHRIRGD